MVKVKSWARTGDIRASIAAERSRKLKEPRRIGRNRVLVACANLKSRGLRSQLRATLIANDPNLNMSGCWFKLLRFTAHRKGCPGYSSRSYTDCSGCQIACRTIFPMRRKYQYYHCESAGKLDVFRRSYSSLANRGESEQTDCAGSRPLFEAAVHRFAAIAPSQQLMRLLLEQTRNSA